MDIPLDTLQLAVLLPSFFLVAGAYASVGLGGGSGYLAIMALVGVPIAFMPSTALTLNLIVTGTALLRYGVAGRFPVRLLLPFLLPALPGAFLGGLVNPPKWIFVGVLGVALVIAGLAMFLNAASDRHKEPVTWKIWSLGVPLGFGIGFVSGFLGIGGGVFLGPVVLLLGWVGPKEAAPMNSLLILLVSATGLVAHGIRSTISVELLVPLVATAFVGGLIGAHVGETRLSATTLKKVLATIVLVAGLRSVLVSVGI